MKYVIIFALVFCTYCSYSQQYKHAYYFDEEFRPVSKSEALIVGRGVKTEKGVTVDFFATKTGKKLFTTDFSDSTLNFMHGRNVEYDKEGRPILSSMYKNNILDGPMLKWDKEGRMTDSVIYGTGKMLNKTKFHYTTTGKLTETDFTDSLNDKMSVVFFDTTGTKTSEVLFTGEKGAWNYYEQDHIYKTDSVFTRDQKDAQFPGGAEAWKRFLERNLDGFTPVKNGAPAGNYTVILQFIVDTTGNISNIKAITNKGFGLEAEAVRVIKKSGKWIPAKQFGKSVKAYRKQPLTFQVIQRNNNINNGSAPSQRRFGF